MTNEASTDSIIIKRVLNGEQNAFGELMTRYEAAFVRFAQRYTHDEDDALDVVQEAFIKMYRNLNSFNLKRPFSSWAYRIVRNESLNWLRARKRLTFGETAEYILGQIMAIGSPELELVQAETQTQLKATFSAMPKNYAEPLRLHFIEEQSYKEISETLNIPVGTVGTRINRAKALFKRLWSEKESSNGRRTQG